MSKAEERAFEVYPYNRAFTNNEEEYDGNFCNRIPYIEGYEQAEQDLALTWEDVQMLDHFVLQLVKEESDERKDWGDGEKFYSEVLRRFLEFKNK